MKKIIATITLLVLTMTIMAGTTQLKNFEEVMTALKEGKEVRMVAHYGQCQLISSNEIKPEAPDAIGGMTLDVWEYFAPMSVGNPQAFVVSSQTKLINYGGIVYNYAKVKVSEDNTVKITAQYINAQSFEQEMDENFFSSINDGKNDGAIYFYTNK